MKHFLIITFLINSTLAFNQNYKFGKVSEAELLEKVHPLESEADAAILYREYKTSFQFNEDESFTVLTDVFERIKIYSMVLQIL